MNNNIGKLLGVFHNNLQALMAAPTSKVTLIYDMFMSSSRLGNT